MKTTVEANYTCSANYFSQDLGNLLEGATFPKACSTPAIDIFSSIDVVFIEEATSFDGSLLQRAFILEYLPSAEITFTNAESMLPVVASYKPESKAMNLICLNEKKEGCPASFTVMAVGVAWSWLSIELDFF